MTSESTTPKARPRILSGVQPSGLLHLGNYFGAIKQHVELQEHGDCYFFIANYHSLTSVRDREAMLASTHHVALAYLALGLDPARTVFYRQSDVPEVTELTWLLTTVVGMGLLERAHSYKEKVARGIAPSAGLFCYPVLMAADILAPQSDMVPVGKDQDQHVQMTRDMAQLFNNAFCRDDPVFRLPEARFSETPRVPGTTFEKGAVVQVSTELGARHPVGGGLVDLDSYVAGLRALVEKVVAGGVSSTEEIAACLDEEHDTALPDIRVVSRTIRVAAEMPGGDYNVVRHEDRVHVEFFVPAEHIVFLMKEGKKVAAKMSKSSGNTIEIFAEGKPLKKRIMGIETHLTELTDPIDSEQDIVFQLFKLFATPAEVADLDQKYRAGGFGFGRAKKLLLERVNDLFAPHRERMRELEQDPDYVEDVLRTGAQKARVVARETVARARDVCGLPPLVG